MRKTIIACIAVFTLFAFAEEKKATFEITEVQYNAVQSLLYDVAMSADSLDGSHKTIRRMQNNVVTIQNFLKEQAGKQFDTSKIK